MKHLSIATIVFALSLGACSDDPTGVPGDDLITLTQSQAVALIAKVEAVGAEDATLAALSDTIDVVIKAGAQARRIDVTSDLGNGPYWAVSLQIFAGTTSTFHVLAFDDPSNPTRFLILGGAVLGSATPVTSASGSIGTNGTTSLTGHLISISGTAVSAWHVSGGSLSFVSHPTTQACPGFVGPGSCVSLTMDATFNFTASVPDGSATGQRTATGTADGIPGIRLSP
jgi:hypothetical protein